MLSGHFDYRRMKMLLPDAEALAAKKKVGLEILAHPGEVRNEKNLSRITNQNDYRFFSSPSRKEEANAFLMLKRDERTVERC